MHACKFWLKLTVESASNTASSLDSVSCVDHLQIPKSQWITWKYKIVEGRRKLKIGWMVIQLSFKNFI